MQELWLIWCLHDYASVYTALSTETYETEQLKSSFNTIIIVTMYDIVFIQKREVNLTLLHGSKIVSPNFWLKCPSMGQMRKVTLVCLLTSDTPHTRSVISITCPIGK